MIVRLLSISTFPLDYKIIRYEEPGAIKALRRLAGTTHLIDKEGYLSNSGQSYDEEANKYTTRLFGVNEALGVALCQRNRDSLREKIEAFNALKDDRWKTSADDDWIEAMRQKHSSITARQNNSNKQLTLQEKKQDDKPSKPDDNKQEDNFFKTLGINMGMSPKAVAARDLAGQQRKDINQFYLQKRFLYPLAMTGLLMADPSYTTAILSARNFGIKDKSRDTKLASVKLLGEIGIETYRRFVSARNKGNLPKPDSGNFIISFDDLQHDINNLRAIKSALSQDCFGIHDKDKDIQYRAKSVCTALEKAEKIILDFLHTNGICSLN